MNEYKEIIFEKVAGIKQTIKKHPYATVAAVTMGVPAVGFPIAGKVIEKRNDKARDKDTETKMGRDYVAPMTIKKMKKFPFGYAKMAIPTAATLYGVLEGRSLAQKKINKMKNLTPEKAAALAKLSGIGGGVLVGQAARVPLDIAENRLDKAMDTRRYNKLSEKYLGRPATKKEKDEIKNHYNTKLIKEYVPGAKKQIKFKEKYSPEIKIQKARREADKNRYR